MSDEDEYFRKLDEEAKAKLRRQHALDEAAEARRERAALHHDKCGKCGGDLVHHAFRGVEVAQCTDCRSVLLDPAELELLAGKDTHETFASFFSMFGAGR